VSIRIDRIVGHHQLAPPMMAALNGLSIHPPHVHLRTRIEEPPAQIGPIHSQFWCGYHNFIDFFDVKKLTRCLGLVYGQQSAGGPLLVEEVRTHEADKHTHTLGY
jgi:hypothetical protein